MPRIYDKLAHIRSFAIEGSPSAAMADQVQEGTLPGYQAGPTGLRMAQEAAQWGKKLYQPPRYRPDPEVVANAQAQLKAASANRPDYHAQARDEANQYFLPEFVNSPNGARYIKERARAMSLEPEVKAAIASGSGMFRGLKLADISAHGGGKPDDVRIIAALYDDFAARQRLEHTPQNTRANALAKLDQRRAADAQRFARRGTQIFQQDYEGYSDRANINRAEQLQNTREVATGIANRPPPSIRQPSLGDLDQLMPPPVEMRKDENGTEVPYYKQETPEESNKRRRQARKMWEQLWSDDEPSEGTTPDAAPSQPPPGYVEQARQAWGSVGQFPAQQPAIPDRLPDNWGALSDGDKRKQAQAWAVAALDAGMSVEEVKAALRALGLDRY